MTRSTRGHTEDCHLWSVPQAINCNPPFPRIDMLSVAPLLRRHMPARGSVEAVVESVRDRIDPTPEEQAALQEMVETLLQRTRTAVAKLGVDAEVIHVGSTARGTWVRGDRDIDVFVRFDPDLDRSRLEELGLQVGNEVLEDGHEEFAEHPYVHGEFDGFEVDLVPCYRVEAATEIQSAVDRTPFHNAYLEREINPELAAEIRLLKQFLKGIEVYGSDLRTEGYSGYLTELLVLAYGGFEATLEAASEWTPPVRLDPADHGAREFEDPLVVIDPTDPERNVGAVVAAENVARLIHHAREFLAEPGQAFFFPPNVDPLSEGEVRAEIDSRGTTLLAVRFDPPDLVEDQLYPQLRRSLSGVVRGLENESFEVLRSAAWADETAVLFVELSVADLPAVTRHEGPPVHVDPHAKRFFETYAEEDVYGPFIDGERYVVERERALTSAREYLAERLLEVSHGAQIKTALKEDGFKVLAGTAVAELAGEFGTEFALYFQPEA